ncbi:hypothetical protein SAZ11_51620 [Streptomyces sp. FXJ1.4098]|nr:hypothetical protein [Streptomyces sp. FXJ1.4098]
MENGVMVDGRTRTAGEGFREPAQGARPRVQRGERCRALPLGRWGLAGGALGGVREAVRNPSAAPSTASARRAAISGPRPSKV